ncbi:MAG TPA: dihydrofolate reductase [Kofleriaceae bacterium]|nr:dihydrofolate reductase [Kofleriaceae bacterium]
MSFDVVVAADLDWGIGKANALPWPKLKGDLAHFRRVTSACSEGKINAIIMGRKTWESEEVKGSPLPRRLNVVVTRKQLTVPEGVVVAASVDAAIHAATAPNVETIFVVGGAEIFKDAFARADLRYVYVTRIEGHFETEVRIPNLDELGFVRTDWDGEQAAEENGVRYKIERLARRV